VPTAARIGVATTFTVQPRLHFCERLRHAGDWWLVNVILLVRHAVPISRGEWRGDDIDRPLTDAGLRRAQGLVTLFRVYRIATILTSPQRRCWETVIYAAAALGARLEFDDRLAGSDPTKLMNVLTENVSDLVAVCGRGQPIRGVLASLNNSPRVAASALPCAQGSVWALRRNAASYDLHEYHPC
jgi:phosphohistidine phosphatase SixA